ncbi:hypothetical protein FHX49_000526 [Microbacterium endophyticum]|uniref:Uncharacterized protein n=1 Tax=Microbacterium endophyticum TaxID=1526412 RepID=A0A7W4V173_9MICO|nr:hypothetical protein [Microbacterium endophyticum]MBB2974985.1 hypothetical protein [Microbacterium endophyticum]NIK37282.1 hypothetical protein [Microbacterium endophyticum]
MAVLPPHVLERGEFDLFNGVPGALPADEFGLVEPVHRLGESIVEAVTDGSC